MDRRAFLTTAGQGALLVALASAVSRTELLAATDQKRYPIPSADGATIDRDDQVILVRSQGQVMAFNLSCPHESSALRWRTDLGRFYCGKHESQYSLAGMFITGRATRNMDRLGISRSGNDVVVDLTRMYKSDLNPAEWTAAVAKVG